MQFFPILLVAHIVLAISLFLPSLLLPFALRAREATIERHSPFVRGLLWLQSNGTVIVGAGLALTGLGLVAALGVQLLSQPWLLAALVLYASNLVLAFFVQRPNLRRLFGFKAVSDAEKQRWRDRARRQRYVSYGMAGLVGLIAFLMSTKPRLW
jgi:hypothetical protein